MPILFTCGHCQRTLRVRDELGGKRVKCPACQSVIRVPSPDGAAPRWYLQTETGETFGPLERSRLDRWAAEGRITADCQVLRAGADQWQWATDLYPHLAGEEATILPHPPAPAAAPPRSVRKPERSRKQFVPEQPPGAGAAIRPKPRAVARGRVLGERGEPRKTSAKSSPGKDGESAEISPRCKDAALLLALFLGILGAHRFYLGYTRLGLVMVATGGGCGVWAAIDFVRLWTGRLNRDAQGRRLR